LIIAFVRNDEMVKSISLDKSLYFVHETQSIT